MKRTALITGASAIGLAAALSHRDIFVTSGTGVDHDAAMKVQQMYDDAKERVTIQQRVIIDDPTPPRRKPYELTDFDRAQLDLAAEKRERKRKARMPK